MGVRYELLPLDTELQWLSERPSELGSANSKLKVNDLRAGFLLWHYLIQISVKKAYVAQFTQKITILLPLFQKIPALYIEPLLFTDKC